MYYAHTKPDSDRSQWEPLEDHLLEVADLAQQFGGKFGFGSIARQLGKWHDLGKYSDAFQNYLIEAGEKACQDHSDEIAQKHVRRVDHSTPGAQFSFKSLAGSDDMCTILTRYLMAYAIAGHHGGLPDNEAYSGLSGLQDRLLKKCESLPEIPDEIANCEIDFQEFSRFKPSSKNPSVRDFGFQFGFLTRMLFSALVDADFLATERFMTNATSQRPDTTGLANWPRLAELLANHVQSRSNERKSRLQENSFGSDLLEYRNGLFQTCIEAGQLARGIYQLEAPVGTGKTLASLGFATHHAIHHAMDRIIYAIPFTSIVDQTAGEFRKLTASLGAHFLVEHHSNLVESHDTTENRLLSENWDAPLIVTTNVQFFESLFASRTGSCRKLHRIANSVIILDEAQSIPSHLLIPCLKALAELVRNYKVTVLLCSATPPAITKGNHFPSGLKSIKDITVDLNATTVLRNRVESEQLATLSIESLVHRIIQEPQALCIVNTRAMAQEIYHHCKSQLSDERQEGLFHLSTWLCGDHRRQILEQIKSRVNSNPRKPCIVISTQVVEAGVDLDFPVVFRALAGLDSIAQAAGRCNREGRDESGKIYIFEPENLKLSGFLGMTIANAREILTPDTDPLDRTTIQKYFEMTYWKLGPELDRHRIVTGDYFLVDQIKSGLDVRFKFREVARKFQMIDDHSDSFVVPFGDEGRSLVDRIQNGERIDRDDLRRLQRFSVNVHHSTFIKLVEASAVLIQENLPSILINTELYDEKIGLDFLNKHPEYLPSESLTC